MVMPLGFVGGRVDLAFLQQSDKRPAAEEAAEMPLLVAEHDDVDAEIGGGGILGDRARRLQRIDAAERTIEPAGMVLAFEMRARQHLLPVRTAPAENVGDAVDLRVKAGFAHPAGKPFARGNVLIRQRRAMHAGLVGAEGCERAQVGQNAFGIDPGHEAGPWAFTTGEAPIYAFRGLAAKSGVVSGPARLRRETLRRYPSGGSS